jgi:ketosteroid isomerase-like protein
MIPSRARRAREDPMSDEAKNVAILTEAYRRWSESKGASADHWIAICDENIRFGSIAEPLTTVAYMASYRSRDELGQYFAGITRDWEMLEYRVDHFVAQGDRVVMLGHCAWRAKGSGKVVSTPKVDSWRFADGKAVEFYEYFDTAQVMLAMAPA